MSNTPAPVSSVLIPVTLFVSLVAYLVSWALPCIMFGNSVGPESGWKCAMIGPWGFILGHFEVLANLFYLASVPFFFYRLYIPTVILSLSGLALGLETLTLFSFPIPLDEGGEKHYLVALFSGYYLWMGSMLLLAGVSAYMLTSKGFNGTTDESN